MKNKRGKSRTAKRGIKEIAALNTVFLCGSEKDGHTLGTLFSVIRAVGKGAVHITGDSVSLIPPQIKNPDFLILDSSRIRNIHTGGGIALLRQRAELVKNAVPPSFYAIVDSDNCEAAGMLRACGIQTVTCGLSQKDSFTFSSLDSDHAVVCLQRGLKSLDGSQIEPYEIPVNFERPENEYALLAAVAVLVLSGIQTSDGIRLCNTD